jgi:hypothetical protein
MFEVFERNSLYDGGHLKRTKADIATLIAELRLDGAGIGELSEMNARAASRIRMGATDALDYAALGYTIHNIYGLIENACLRISKFFENGLSSEAWHRDVLNRMLLEIPRMRPAFFSRDEFLVMDELRSFQHVFRNLYGRPIDAERILALQGKVPSAVRTFEDSVRRYSDFLERLGDSLEE